MDCEAGEEVSAVAADGVSQDPDQNFRCQHYRRKCQFVTPCCNRVYRCRFCHDEEQNHPLRREDVNMVECSACGTRQGVTEYCSNCGIKFGMYFCYECKLYDDEDKQQFHCKGCGICRVGGRENYFHCHRCDMCLPNHLEGAHKCVEKVSRGNCPVCQEDIHTSRIPSQIPPCNHLIHKNCFDEMLSNGHYACPVCGVSMIDMKEIWKIYDKDIEETPMPEEYRHLFAKIKCRDCLQTSLSSFHILGIKCTSCGSYNTVRDKGPLVRLQNNGEGASAAAVVPDLASTTEGQAQQYSDDQALESTATLTPPETPNRDQMTETSLGLQPFAGHSSHSLGLVSPPTPEASPIREVQDDAGTTSSMVNSSAVRRILFNGAGGGGASNEHQDHDYSWGVDGHGDIEEDEVKS